MHWQLGLLSMDSRRDALKALTVVIKAGRAILAEEVR
jgi:hypothetical protein